MYNELLKQHEEILKKLTDKASKETDFGERGQFMNLQKMVDAEIKAIKNINEIIETMSKIELPTLRKKVTEELAMKMLDDYTKHLTRDGVFDSTKTLKEKHDFIIKVMSE